MNKEEIKQISERMGFDIDKINNQLNLLKANKGFVKIHSECSIGNGIIKIDENNFDKYIDLANQIKSEGKITKFVPASGAASRMFILFQKYLDKNVNAEEENKVEKFINELKNYPFYDEIPSIINNTKEIIEYILSDKNLGYLNKPKGMIHFDKYENQSFTAFELQILEAIEITKDKKNKSKVHFTLAEDKFNDSKNQIESFISRHNINIEVSYSVQDNSTNTISIDEKLNPVLDKNGNLLLRPAGHGALIHNFNKLNSEIVFIKNIDNIRHYLKEPDQIFYAKVILGLLFEVQTEIFKILELNPESLFSNQTMINSIIEFGKEYFFKDYTYVFRYESLGTKVKLLHNELSRPIRVCGMVKNEGDPGGGPFWIQDLYGEKTLQIVELSQIDTHNQNQNQIINKSTHFNPVFIACSLKNYKGEDFDLLKFVDDNSYIITEKTHLGNKIKVLELPGLWNGAMAKWNTIFVELPQTVFTPVKTIFDLKQED